MGPPISGTFNSLDHERTAFSRARANLRWETFDFFLIEKTLSSALGELNFCGIIAVSFSLFTSGDLTLKLVG